MGELSTWEANEWERGKSQGGARTLGHSQVGNVNPYKCSDCLEFTMTIHVDAGTTPAMMGCGAAGFFARDCEGLAFSAGYPRGPLPVDWIKQLAWEWYLPGEQEFRKLSVEEKQHVDSGGVLLRPLTELGKLLVPEPYRDLVTIRETQ